MFTRPAASAHGGKFTFEYQFDGDELQCVRFDGGTGMRANDATGDGGACGVRRCDWRLDGSGDDGANSFFVADAPTSDDGPGSEIPRSSYESTPSNSSAVGTT